MAAICPTKSMELVLSLFRCVLRVLYCMLLASSAVICAHDDISRITECL